MRTSESPLKKNIKAHHKTSIGEVFIFDNYIVSEFNEGIDINFENYYEVSVIIEANFKNKPFGFIANRINSYSINLADAHLFNEAFPNCEAYAIVTYNNLSDPIVEIENKFFKFNRQKFKNLLEGANWIEQTLAF